MIVDKGNIFYLGVVGFYWEVLIYFGVFNFVRWEFYKGKNGLFGFIIGFLFFIFYYDVISVEIEKVIYIYSILFNRISKILWGWILVYESLYYIFYILL